MDVVSMSCAYWVNVPLVVMFDKIEMCKRLYDCLGHRSINLVDNVSP